MCEIKELYKIAESNDIEVFNGNFPICKGIASDGFIGIDNDLKGAGETVCLAHELGHCMTGAFYSVTAPMLDRVRAERKADKWAIKKLVPADELERAMKCHYLFEVAEIFGVTEDFIRKAVKYYAESQRLWKCG